MRLDPGLRKELSFLVRSVFVTFLISSVLLCLTSCTKREEAAGPPEKITIAYPTTSNTILIYIAFAKGYFREENLDAIPQPYAFGKLALKAVTEGKADLATAGDTPIVFAIMNGEKITTLAVIQTSNRDNAIVARRDRSIEKPSDLKGKKIGVTAGTTSDFFANSFLLAHDIDKKQVRLIDVKPDEMAEALDTGKVEAVSTFNPTLKQLQRGLGEKGIIFYGELLYTETFCVIVGQEYVKNNPGAIKKVLRALIKAEAFVQRHPEEARRLVAEFTKVDKVTIDEIWEIVTPVVRLDQALLVDLEDQTRWVLKNNLAKRSDMPNYLDFIYVDGLQAVKPEAVRLVR